MAFTNESMKRWAEKKGETSSPSAASFTNASMLRWAANKAVQESKSAPVEVQQIKLASTPSKTVTAQEKAVQEVMDNTTPAQRLASVKNVTTLPVLDDIKQDITQTVKGAAANQELGQFGAGNIDLYNRPKATNADGTTSTVHSTGFNVDGKEVLVPTVWMKDGKAYHSDNLEEILQHYYDTGEYLGKFDTVDDANEYAEKLHLAQDYYYRDRGTTSDTAQKSNGERTSTGAGRQKTAASELPTKQRDLSTIKSELEAAKAAEKKALAAANQYIADNEGWLDTKDPAELQALKDAATAATNARVELEKEYNNHTDSFEDQFGQYSGVEKAAMGIIGSPLYAMDVIGQTAKSALTGDNGMDMDTLAMQNYKKTQQLKSSATENLSGAGKFLADTGISIAQNLYGLPMNVIAPGGSLAVMGAGAAADKMVDVGDSGGSATSALVRGGISGGIEALTEKLPLDSLANLVKTGGKTVVKNLLKQGGVEATEEGLSYAMNYIADKAAQDPEAKWDWAEFANSVASGGLSGLFFGLGGTMVNRVNNTITAMPGSGIEGAQSIDRKVTELPRAEQVNTDTTGTESAVEGVQGQNNTASTGETVNGNGLSAYSEQEINNFSSGKKNKIVSTFADAVNFIRNALSNNQSNEKAYFGKITNTVAQQVLAETGMDIAGYNAILQSDNARHIMKQHGNVMTENARGQVAVTAEGIALIPQVLAAPDSVSVSPELDSRGRKVLIFEKQIGDNYVTMQAVSDGKHALQTDTLFIKKTKNSQGTGYNANQNTGPVHNAQSVPPQSSSNTNISDNVSGVNRNSAQTSQNDASNKRFAMSADGLVDEVVSGDYGRNTVGSAEAVSPYQEAPTQSVADRMFTEQEMQKHDLESKHQVYSNKQSRYDAAVMLDSDYEGEVERLKTDEWGAAENVEGHMILENLVKQAVRTGADEDWAKVTEWKHLFDAKGGTKHGQALQSRKQFANSAATLTAEAADFLDSDKAKKLNREKRTAVMDSVADQSEALENIPKGDTGALIDLIKRNSEIRRTTGLFSKKTSKQMNWALNYIADNVSDGEAFLRGVAADQIRSIPLDYSKTSFTEKAKSLRVQFMLSKISTIMRNLASNNVFDPLETLSNDVGLVADLLMSKVTGQRTTAFEKSWASKAKWHGSLEGALKSFVEVGLDADSAGSKYEGTGGRTFKMAGNPFERFLSTWSKFQNYTLTTTDEFQKGGIRAETQENIDKLKRSGKLDTDSLNEWADETAKQRTFQNDSRIAKSMIGLRNAANNIISVGDIGAGDILMSFARVPGNLAAQAANYSPVGMINGLRQTVEVMIDSKRGNYSAEKQAQAARNFGRGLTGTGLLAAFTALALKGVIDVAGDDDEDKEALERAQGRTGTQWNLSATLRLLNSGDPAWRDGDMLMSIGFLDPINSIMAAGALLADEYKEDGGVSAEDVMKASIGAIWQSVLDLPAMSSINDLMTTYEYAEGDIPSDKLTNTILDYAGGELESFVVPNFLRGIATGLDDTVRNRYGGETIKETTVDGIKSGLPVFRESLPASLDPFGREKTQTGNTALNILNNNLLPGALTRYKETDVEKTLEDVYKATGNAAVYPDRKAPSSFSVDNQKYTLDQEMKDEFMTTAGETALEIMMDLIDSESFQMMNEETQGQYLALANEYARAVAKVEVTDGKYELTGTSKKIAAAEDAGLSAADYIMYKLDSEAYNEDGEGTMKISEVAAAIQNSGMSEKEQTAYWLVSYPEWPEKAEEKGVDIENYIQLQVSTYGLTGDKNGNTISGSKKEKVLKAINAINTSTAQKDAMYYAMGYSEKDLKNAPWH